MAAQHGHGQESAFAGQYSPVVRRLAWPLGGRAEGGKSWPVVGAVASVTGRHGRRRARLCEGPKSNPGAHRDNAATHGKRRQRTPTATLDSRPSCCVIRPVVASMRPSNLPFETESGGPPRKVMSPPFANNSRLVSRRGLVLRGLGAVGLSGLSTAVYAGAVEPERLITTAYRVSPPQWTAGRLSLAVIADLHAGGPNMTLEHIARVVDVTNALRPDLIVLLGDYIARHSFVTEPVPPDAWAAQFARLSAPLGVWAILGNHDWWCGVGVVRGALASAGVPCLENHAILLGEGDSRFWIAGLGDQLAHRVGPGTFRGEDDLSGTLAQVTTNHPVILLGPVYIHLVQRTVATRLMMAAKHLSVFS
jgi:uncharacterized protein